MVDSESRFAIIFVSIVCPNWNRFLRKYHCDSREEVKMWYFVKLTGLAHKQKEDS